MHVLVIEPDPVLAKIYEAALTAAGQSVARTTTAQSAVHAADKRTPDAVVLELQMPRHNGVEFLYEFRSYPEWQHIPVVIHSFMPPSELAHMPTLASQLNVTAVLHKQTTELHMLVEAVAKSVAVPSV